MVVALVTTDAVMSVAESAFAMLGAIINELGAVISRPKVGLFVSCDGHRLNNGSSQQRVLPLYSFPRLFFIAKDRSFGM